MPSCSAFGITVNRAAISKSKDVKAADSLVAPDLG
jgi:hypothetical protein